MHIGFVGAGLMGHGAAKHILAAGYPVTVIAHTNRAPIDDLVARGATEARTVAELTTASDVVFLCLPDSTVVERVAHAEDGLLAGAHPDLIVLDMTTSLPEATKRLAAELAAHDAKLLDAPMTRTPKEAEEGRLNVLIGGDAETVARVLPVLRTFTEEVFQTGTLGSAHTFKLLHNFVAIANMATVLESAVAARKLGIDLEQFHAIGSAGGAASIAFDRIMPYPISGDATRMQAHASTALKDLAYYNTMADEAGLYSTMSKAAQQLFQLASTLGHDETHVPVLFDVFSDINKA